MIVFADTSRPIRLLVINSVNKNNYICSKILSVNDMSKIAWSERNSKKKKCNILKSMLYLSIVCGFDVFKELYIFKIFQNSLNRLFYSKILLTMFQQQITFVLKNIYSCIFHLSFTGNILCRRRVFLGEKC